MTRPTHCKRGHPWTPANTRCYGPGKRYRTCRICAAASGRKKYRNNPEYRAYMIDRGKARYHASKEKPDDQPTAHIFSADQGVCDHDRRPRNYDGDWSGCYRGAGVDSSP